MILEVLEDIVKLTVIVASLFLSLRYFIRKKRPNLTGDLEKRRLAVLFGLVLIVLALKIGEDVLGGESGPVDKTVLLFIHSHVPSSLLPFFTAITFTGSAKFLLPLTGLTTLGLFLARHRHEALLLALSQISAVLTVVIIKTVVARDRPELWQTSWYWGASFPSGHTLGVAAFATAVTLSMVKIKPGAHGIVMALASLWIFSVGLSRLVLGVHWPTDVLAAACIGTFLPLLIMAFIHFHQG
jgi:undecaprenyl-diphosphatase